MTLKDIEKAETMPAALSILERAAAEAGVAVDVNDLGGTEYALEKKARTDISVKPILSMTRMAKIRKRELEAL